eukprot:TRINITY_DN1273_c0_g1_i1.p1 TRINITY_DN1273_c0_g1~~TRINITY_DN1273_c0_g1_i1.p1  ORF type:complete len:207 (+),score=15.52 TRINITY_DN1273_c0_g1_i1:323-943(+)
MRKDKDLDFLDIGANVGCYALAVGLLGRRVVAVEPFPPTHDLICKSIETGNYSNIHLINNVLSNKRTDMSFDMSFYRWHKNVGGTKVKIAGAGDRYVIESILLDDLLDVFRFKKAIIKMDVENHEEQVLQGARKFFQTVDVKVVLMEWLGKTRWDAEAVYKLMKIYNMVPFDPYKLTPIPADHVVTHHQKYGDLLWVKDTYQLEIS